jgi:copper(I)-binding protein
MPRLAALSPPAVLLALAPLVVASCSGAGSSERFRSGAITVTDVIMQQPMTFGGEGGAGSTLYFTVLNGGGSDDTLLAVRSDRVGEAALHGVDSKGMMEVASAIAVPAGGRLRLRPGGYHVMLSRLSGAPAAGDTIPFELTFRHAGSLQVRAPVVPLTGMQEALDRAARR